MSAVTIGLPMKDNAATVLDTVRSVFRQTEGDWRLIVVDDGSTDASVDLVRRIEDPRVTVLHDGENRGLAARLNQLAGLAPTEVLLRMDADDLMHPDRVRVTLAALARRPEADLVAAHAISIDAANRLGGVRRSRADTDAVADLRNSPYVHPAVGGRTEWFRAHPYDESFRRCQDQELWVRTRAERRTVVLDDVLLYLREAGTVPAEKYGRSMAGTRAVIRRHGHVVGRRRAAVLVAETWAKQAVYRSAERLHLVDRVVARRAEVVDAAVSARHAEVVQRILSTPLPGIDG